MIKIFSRGEAPPPFFVGKCVAIRYYNYQTILNYIKKNSGPASVIFWEYDAGTIYHIK